MRVSVIVPTRNRPELLAQCLTSLTRQTMPRSDFEVLVVNDGGQDVRALVAAAELPGAAVTIAHGGQGAACNAGLALAHGDYVTIAHDDDLVLPDKLAVLADALDDAAPSVAAVYGLPRYTTRTGVLMERPGQLERFQRKYPRLTWDDLMDGSGLWVHGTATMYRRDWLEQIGGWDAELETAEEYDLHLRLLHAGGAFEAVPVDVVTYRAGGKSTHYRRGKRGPALARVYGRLGLDRAAYNARMREV